jgi:diguanylate cyclase (GGDEF)-like protein
MNTSAISLSIKGTEQGRSADNQQLEALILYKRRTEWLLQVNALQASFAGVLDLVGMIEAFSGWLMDLVPHDLLVYHHPGRQRTQMFCSVHGPKRRKLLHTAKMVLAALAGNGGTGNRHGEIHLASWEVDGGQERSVVLLFRQKWGFETKERCLLKQARAILKESLPRALEYEDLYEQSRRDSLTGLANRRVLEERLITLLESARRHGHPLTLASMDLDHFKLINDTLGHGKGDEVLQQVGRIMAGKIRNGDLLVRMGGDEFVLLMADTDRQAAGHLLKRLKTAVEELDIGVGWKLEISIGVSQWQPGYSRDEWFQRADENLYQAKAVKRIDTIPSPAPYLPLLGRSPGHWLEGVKESIKEA